MTLINNDQKKSLQWEREMTDDADQDNGLELAVELTIAWLSNPNTRAQANEVPDFLRTMHEAVGGLSGTSAPDTGEEQPASYEPAVTVRKSLASKDHIISLIDGKPYKTLKRHLANHGLTPAEYRQRYGLKADYPMVAPAYAEQRRSMAKKIGLGRRGKEGGATSGQQSPDGDAAARKPAARRGRPRKADQAS